MTTKETLYKTGDRIDFYQHGSHRCSGTILERCPFLESLAGNIHFKVRVDTVSINSHCAVTPLKVGALWYVKADEIVGPKL